MRRCVESRVLSPLTPPAIYGRTTSLVLEAVAR